ncbi:MAG TPA: DUF4124 domain-containing protein [Steroidobacteraceae bacterium]|nr:DUF4124 domain-containing protein [Steroidobacteraceae bacterium]
MHAPAWILLAASLLAWTSSEAQIFECAGKDGSRVFSDKRCGPDAKVVQPKVKPKPAPPQATSTSPKATTSKAPTPKPVKTRKPPEELEQLSLQCNGGDMKACTDWTMGGGPELLRDQERKAEQECEAGSLAACEERYCREGIDADCRARVQRTARLAGDTWYLRDETRDSATGITKYLVRCIPEGARESRDVLLSCSSEAGPNRCYLADPQHGFPRLAPAAAAQCARRPAAAPAN